MKRSITQLTVACATAVVLAGSLAAKDAEVLSSAPIAQVWAGHPVGFSFQTHKGRLYAAYYDAARQLTIASCALADPKSWTYQKLPTRVVWDSHNYVTFAFDANDDIHLAGNMHVNPLIYFRTQKPLDLASFVRVPKMVGARERRCTYPQFMRGANQEFIFHYRDGSSGNGDEIYNVYDAGTKTWTRMLDRPLTDGKGLMNAYFAGPVLGPDGWFHLVWVWRDTYRCETNHNLSYMRSRDLRHWETVKGEAVTLPVTLETPGLIVVPSPRAHSGLINMDNRIGFDADKRVIISYHKYDANGFSQIYNARWENGAWAIHQATAWKMRWNFSGGGCIPCDAWGSAVERGVKGELVQRFRNAKDGTSTQVLDPVTLKGLAPYKAPPKDRLPVRLSQVEGKFPGLARRTVHVKGETPDIHYYFTWETLSVNRDLPRKKPWPEPSPLTLWVVRGNL